MHSVFRIIAKEPDHSHILEEAMTDFNAVQKGAFGKMKKYDAISATILEDGCWENHCNEIKKFIVTFSSILKKYGNGGLCYHVDVAIEDCDDIKDRLITSFVCELDILRVLVANNVSLEFSYYNTK